MFIEAPRDKIYGITVDCEGVDTGRYVGPAIEGRPNFLVLHFCGEHDCECWQKVKAELKNFDEDTQKDV